MESGYSKITKNCILSVLFLIGLSSNLNAQFTDRFWTFGDSAAINFKILNNPVPDSSILRVRGDCASICDSNGDLLLYCGSPNQDIWRPPGPPYIYDDGFMLNRYNNIISNGDSLKCNLGYQEMIITPNPGNSNQFYVFTAGVLSSPLPMGFFYNIVDLSLNNDSGYVIQKNIPIASFQVGDGVAAVKHGNGRDWWVIFRPWDTNISNNTFYLYLVSMQGLSGPIIQNVGTSVAGGGGFRRNEFSKDGTKLFSSTTTSLIEIYDFDRCTGIISNPTTVSPTNQSAPYKKFWSLAVSPDKSKIYVTTTNTGATSDSSFLIQFNLNSSNILGTSDTLFALKRPQEFENMQLGPDDKLYICTMFTANDGCFDYLFCDSTRNQTNLNLSVVNYPDSLGAACDFQPFSFYLGGKRAYCGLPNNPNYELGPLIGSSCDTLTVGIAENPMYSNNIIVYYDGDWKTAFVNAKNLHGKNFTFELFNINGQLIKQESGKLLSEFYTQNLDMSSYADNIYIVRLITEKEVLTTRFVKR
jgi:hypothetical protein